MTAGGTARDPNSNRGIEQAKYSRPAPPFAPAMNNIHRLFAPVTALTFWAAAATPAAAQLTPPVLGDSSLHFVRTDYFPPQGFVKVPGKIEFPNLALSEFEFTPSPAYPRLLLPAAGASLNVT